MAAGTANSLREITKQLKCDACHDHYKVILANVGWVDFDFVCSTILPNYPANSAKLSSDQAE